MKLPALAIFIVLFTNFSFSQNHKNNHCKNFTGFFVGNTIITQTGFQMPTVGITFIREVAPNIGLGIVAEYEFGSHIVQKNEEGNIVSEVERKGAFLVLPSAFFKLYKGLIVTIGCGLEFEKHENLLLSKLGVEYRFQMQNPNWIILPSASWDHAKIFDGIVYGVTFGYKF